MHGTQTLELLLRCLSNIDEEVLRHACDALYCLISRCEPARLLLLRRRGIADLAECLRDYNTAIKATSLQILCVLAAESGAARHEMRQEEVLMEVLKTVQAFPAEDVTPHVLESALEAVSHIVLECRANQDYIRNVNGLEPLVDVLEHCAKNKSRPGTAGANPPNRQDVAAARRAAAGGARVPCAVERRVQELGEPAGGARARRRRVCSRSSSRPHPAAPSAARCRRRRSPSW